MEFTDDYYIPKLQKPFNVLLEIAQGIEVMPQYARTRQATCIILHTSTMLSHNQTTAQDKSE